MCRLSEERDRDGGKSEIAGNETMLGQLSSFVENLHLSYREVYEIIPYRNLVLMQKDKLHIVTGSIVKKESGKEMAERRRRKK